MKIFKSLRTFFGRIKDAFKELFGIDKADKTVEVREYERETRNDDGDVISVERVKVINPNGTWKDLGNKFKNKVMEGANYILDNPKKAFAWITAGGFGLGAVLSAMERCKKIFIDPIERRRERREESKVIYDNYGSKYGRARYSLKRPLRGYEQNYVNAETAKGRSMVDVLQELRVLA